MPETEFLYWPKVILTALAGFVFLSAAFSIGYWYGIGQTTQQTSTSELTPTSTQPIGEQETGNIIAFVKDGDVWMINPDGSGEIRLTSDANANKIKWSPDGNFIGWIEQKEFHYSNENTEWIEEVGVSLKVISLQTREIKEVVSQTFSDSKLRTDYLSLSLYDFDFSKDSSQIVYVRDGVWLKNLNTGAEQRIAANDLGEPDDPVDDNVYKYVDWSPTSDTILLYQSFWDCGAGVLYHLDSGKFEPVDLAACSRGYWAPDGKNIISYVSSPRGENRGLWITSLEGQNKHRIASAIKDASDLVWSASMSSKGQLIAIIEPFPPEDASPEKAQAIYRVNNGVAEHLIYVNRRSSSLQWSPDGTKITYLSWVKDDPLSGSPAYDFRVLDADGRNEKVLATDVSSYSWSPR